MKKLLTAVLLVAALAANASTRLYVTLTITNQPSNGATCSVNGLTFTWTNSVPTNSAGLVLWTNTTAWSASNLWAKYSITQATNTVPIMTAPTNVQFIATVDSNVTVAVSSGWASLVRVTNSVQTGYTLTVPPPTNAAIQTILMDGLVRYLNEAQSTLTINPTSAIWAPIKTLITNAWKGASNVAYNGYTPAYRNDDVGELFTKDISGIMFSPGGIIGSSVGYGPSDTHAIMAAPSNSVIYGSGLSILDTNTGSIWNFYTNRGTYGAGYNSNTVTRILDFDPIGFTVHTGDPGGPMISLSYNGVGSIISYLGALTNQNANATNMTIVGTKMMAKSSLQGSLDSSIGYITSLVPSNNASVPTGTNYVVSVSSVSGSWTICGMADHWAGKMLRVWNQSGWSGTFASENGFEATPGNRITIAGGTNVAVPNGAWVEFYYDGTSSRWALNFVSSGSTNIASAGASALSGLTDVVLTNLAASQVLTYNGSGWVNSNAPTGSGGSATNAQPPSATLTNLSGITTNVIVFSNQLNSVTNKLTDTNLFTKGLQSITNQFSIIILGDQQTHLQNYTNEFRATISNIIGHTVSDKIAALIHTGDFSNNNSNQQQIADLKIWTNSLAGLSIPFGWSVGNHDFDYGANLAVNGTTTNFDNYLGPSWLTNQSWFKGGLQTNATSRNYYLEVTNTPCPLLILCLEYGATPLLCNWASNTCSSHPGWLTLCVMHEYLNTSGRRQVAADAYNPAAKQNALVAEDRWLQSLSYWPDLRFTFNGHDILLTDPTARISRMEDMGIYGNTVESIYINAQQWTLIDTIAADPMMKITFYPTQNRYKVEILNGVTWVNASVSDAFMSASEKSWQGPIWRNAGGGLAVGDTVTVRSDPAVLNRNGAQMVLDTVGAYKGSMTSDGTNGIDFRWGTNSSVLSNASVATLTSTGLVSSAFWGDGSHLSGVSAAGSSNFSRQIGMDQGIVLNVSFSEGSGTTVTDVSPYTNTLTARRGDSTPNAIWTNGITGSGLAFFGTNYVTIDGASNQLKGFSSFTMGAWFQTTYGSNNAQILISSTQGGYTSDYYLGLVYSNVLRLKLTTNGQSSGTILTLDVYLSTNFTDNRWHYYAGTYDGANVLTYYDGLQVGSNAMIGLINNSVSTVEIGGYNGYLFPFAGNIDDVRMWNRALSATEIRMLYQQAGIAMSLGWSNGIVTGNGSGLSNLLTSTVAAGSNVTVTTNISGQTTSYTVAQSASGITNALGFPPGTNGAGGGLTNLSTSYNLTTTNLVTATVKTRYTNDLTLPEVLLYLTNSITFTNWSCPAAGVVTYQTMRVVPGTTNTAVVYSGLGGNGDCGVKIWTNSASWFPTSYTNGHSYLWVTRAEGTNLTITITDQQ